MPSPYKRKVLPFHGVGDEERDELLHVLIGPEVVGAARDDDGNFVRLRVREAHEVAAALAGRIGIAGIERRFFGEVLAVARAVHFVGGDLHVALHLELARVVQKVVRALDVGLDEAGRFFNRAIDVGFGGKVEHDLRARHGFAHGLGIADVPSHKAHAAGIHQIADVLHVARVGERVEHGDFGVGLFLRHEAHEVGADETGAAGDEHGAESHLSVLL
jgi:hypothetical protein